MSAWDKVWVVAALAIIATLLVLFFWILLDPQAHRDDIRRSCVGGRR